MACIEPPRVAAQSLRGRERRQTTRGSIVARANNAGEAAKFPQGEQEALERAANSVEAALSDGKSLLEVEMPSSGLYGASGDLEGGAEMDRHVCWQSYSRD